MGQPYSSQQPNPDESLHYEEREIKLGGVEYSLCTTPNGFKPNAVTRKFVEVMQKLGISGTVLDIGTGVCPLGIWAAKNGAEKVYAVDPVAEHIAAAKKNVQAYGLEDKVNLYLGEFFRSLQGLKKKANTIVADISGLADKVARAIKDAGSKVPWYSGIVPTGGEDGTEKIITVLEQAPDYLADGAKLIFPVATDLSYGEKIMQVANRCYSCVEAAFKDPIRFFLTQEQFTAILDAYNQILPDFIKIVRQGSRYVWTGQIYVASNPR